MNKGLVEMFRYNAWANKTLFEACRSLTEAQLAARVPAVSGSVAELLQHIVGGQQTFVLRTKGRQHEGELSRESEWPGIDRLIALIAETDRTLISIAEKLNGDEEIDLPFMGSRYRFPVRFFLVHAIGHSAEHRTEVKLALEQIGVATPDLDGWHYATVAGYGEEVE